MKKLLSPILGLAVALVTSFALIGTYRYALADNGSGSASATTVAAATADQLHDPLSAPAAAYDDLAAAKRLGWPALGFAILFLGCKLLGRAESVPFLAFLGKGKTPVIVGGLAALAAACYNAAASGGSWMALGMAGMVSFATYYDAATKPPTSKP